MDCEFKNLTAAAHTSTDSTFYFCTFEWIGTSGFNAEVVKGKNFIGNRFYIPSDSVDEVIVTGYNRAGIIAQNSVYMTTGSQDDTGFLINTNHCVVHNYFEGATTAINNYGKGAYIRSNVFYDCGTNVSTRSTSVNLVDSDENSTTLSASGLPSISGGDFTPSDDLRDASSTMSSSGSTSNIKHQMGGVLNFPTASGGLSYTPTMRRF